MMLGDAGVTDFALICLLVLTIIKLKAAVERIPRAYITPHTGKNLV